MESLVYDKVGTCDEIVDMPETTSIKSVYEKGYYLSYIMCMMLLIFNAIGFSYLLIK